MNRLVKNVFSKNCNSAGLGQIRSLKASDVLLERKNYHDPSWAMSKFSRAENIIYCITHWLSFLSSCIFRGITYSCSKDFTQNVHYKFLSENTYFLELLFFTIVFGTESIWEKIGLNEKTQSIILQYLTFVKLIV